MGKRQLVAILMLSPLYFSMTIKQRRDLLVDWYQSGRWPAVMEAPLPIPVLNGCIRPTT